jgi:hypothetical protein
LRGWETSNRSDAELTVLGKQNAIPYKVQVIQQAYENLYGLKIPNLTANYQYVRFLPQNAEDVKKMLDSGIEFWDTPLEYDILIYGEKYHDPSISDTEITWQYAVVPVDMDMPAVQSEVLEYLALVPEDCALAREAFKISGNEYDTPDELVSDPIIINNKFDYQIKRETEGGEGDGTTTECNCPLPDHIRKPSGCVQVFDNQLSLWEGVINVQVHTAKTQVFGSVFHRTAETDANGCWMINHRYSGKIHVWVKWVNKACDVKTMDGNLDLWGYTFPRRAYIGKFWGPNFNDISIKFDHTSDIGSWAFRNWVASTINNSVFEFRKFITDQSIEGSLPNNLKILTTPWGDQNDAAAPMLDKLGPFQQLLIGVSSYAILRSVCNVYYAAPYGIVLPQIAAWMQVVGPDINFNLNNSNQVNSDDIRETAYHELAHALHFNKVGSSYWLKNMAYVILHRGYGDGTDPNAGRCSVIETWGFQVGILSAHLRYGNDNSNGGDPSFNTWRRRLELSYGWAGTFIPFGWQWDIQDNNATNPPNETENGTVITSGGDAVSGFTNAQIFATMNSNMTSIPQMKTALLPFLPPTIPVASYNALCSAYGF